MAMPNPGRRGGGWLSRALPLAEALEVADQEDDGRITGCHLQMITSPGLGVAEENR